MNSKAFTMIEMLGVVAILALISLFSFPAINILKNNSDQKKYDNFIKNISLAADSYIESNYTKYDSDLEQFITIKKLIDEGLLSNTLVNPNTSEKVIDENGIIKVTRNIDRTFSYEYEISEYIMINSIEDLVTLSKNVDSGNTYQNKVIVLTKNLDFNETSSYVDSSTTSFGDVNGDGTTSSLLLELTTVRGFNPIGSSTIHFKGSFLGDDYTISNLLINRSLETEVGLFSYLDGATVSSLTLKGTVNGASNTGLLAGKIVASSSISNIIIDSKTQYSCPSCTINNIGGLIGYGENASLSNISGVAYIDLNASNVGGVIGNMILSTISNTKLNTTILNANTNVGGLIGLATNANITELNSSGRVNGITVVGGTIGKISSSSAVSKLNNNVSVTGGTNTGGVFGTIETSTINLGNNTGDVIGTQYVGGIAGNTSGATVQKSLSAGLVKGTNYIGGLIGSATNSTLTNSYNMSNIIGETKIGGLIGNTITATITNSYNASSITGNSEIGGIIGVATSSSILNNSYCSNNYNIIGTNTSSTNNGSSSLTEAQMYLQSSYVGWDFTNIWQIETNSYPKFKNNN